MLEFSSTESCTTSNTSTPLVGFSSNDSSCDGNVALMNDFESTEGCSGQGPQGPEGFSAYQIAVFDGFVGTETQWLASLVGPQGSIGPIGPQGPIGLTGPGVPVGGTAGQILAKIDLTNYNTQWINNFALPALTSGSVLFSNGTTIAQDNANFFFDDTNNRLGIGTNVPAANLHINSAALTELRLQSTVQAVKFTLAGISYNNLIANNAVPFYFDFYENLNFRGNASTTIMRLSTSTSNVLINSTTDNGGKLQIKAGGASGTDIALRVRNSGDTADILNVAGNGFVGIGIAVPAYLLDVNGTINSTISRIGGVSLALSSQGGGTISSSNSVGNNNGAWINLNGPAYLNPATGNNGMFAINGQYFVQSGNSNFNHLTLSPIINATASYLGIIRGLYYNPTLTNIVGVTHRAIETTSGNILFNDNVNNQNVTISKNNVYTNHDRWLYLKQTTAFTGNPEFGLSIGSYADASGANRNLEITAVNTVYADFIGNWNFSSVLSISGGLTNNFHSNLLIAQKSSNNIDTGIQLYNSNNSYVAKFWRDGKISFADSSYNTDALIPAKLFIKGIGAGSGTTTLLIQNSSLTNLLAIRDDGMFNIYAGAFASGIGVRLNTLGTYSSAGLNLHADAIRFNQSGILYFTQTTGVSSPGYTLTNSTTFSPTAGTANDLNIGSVFSAGAGAALYRPLTVTYTLNNTGAQTGTATGIFLNATETALNGMVHNLMDLQLGGVSRIKGTNAGTLFADRFTTNANGSIIGMLTSSYGSLQGSSNTGFLEITETANNKIRINTGTLVFNSTINCFNGTTNLFPAIGRSNTALTFILADNSGYAQYVGRLINWSTALKNSASNLAAGLIVYDTTLNKLSFYNGTTWETVTSV